jgi:hypothetical protein
LIVRPLNERIRFLFVRRGLKVQEITKHVPLTATQIRLRLVRMGLWHQRVLKSKDQRAALARLRIASGQRRLGSAYDPGTMRAQKPAAHHKVSVPMIVWRGTLHETEVRRHVRDCGAGAGSIICIECDGTKVVGDEPCTECKGSGRVFVSV